MHFCANTHSNDGDGFGDTDDVTYHFMNTYSTPNKALSAMAHFSFDPPHKPVRLACKIIPILQINEQIGKGSAFSQDTANKWQSWDFQTPGNLASEFVLQTTTLFELLKKFKKFSPCICIPVVHGRVQVFNNVCNITWNIYRHTYKNTQKNNFQKAT